MIKPIAESIIDFILLMVMIIIAICDWEDADLVATLIGKILI